MRAFRPLLAIIIIVLAIVFVLENQWMTDERTLGFRLFTYDFGSTPSFPLWGLVLAAFFVGYLLGWGVGRLDIWSLRGQLRKARRRTDELEAQKTAPIAHNPVGNETSKETKM